MPTFVSPRLICVGSAHRVERRTTVPDGTSPARDYAVVTVLTEAGGFMEVLHWPGEDGKVQGVPEQGKPIRILVDVDARRGETKAGNPTAELKAVYAGEAVAAPLRAAV